MNRKVEPMASLTFVGAAGTVTGSKHLVETAAGHRFLVDCGMFQGPSAVTALNAAPLPVPPAEIEAVVVTHGHIDHVGYLPKIVKDGFKGPIYCTPPTQALLKIVLEDAAGLQAGLQRHGSERGHETFHEVRPPAPPLYDLDDVTATLKLVQTVELHAAFDVFGASVTYKNAGHIIGSAFADMTVDGRHVIFSGDLGRYNRPLLFDPEDLTSADVVICESTYGDRLHPPDPLGDLQKALDAALDRGGPIVIPAFAVERTQDMLLAIATLQRSDSRIATLPVHVDSPMAIKVDGVFKDFPEWYRPLTDSAAALFGCRNVTVHITTEDSKQLNTLATPAIVIASSGMLSGGRILHHVFNHVSDPKSTIIFCGFQSPGTLGSILVGGAKTIRMYGQQLPVHATIVNLAGYSAHADQNELLRWLGTLKNKPTLYAVHGDPDVVTTFDRVVTEKLGLRALAGTRGATVQL
jgi:metallo-beta-lactamase family protein